ncbi:MAG: Unknown protein [uncultured Sulfurovum sp.]|uniref:DUF1882 domain-containing protein n=1 Tax=uncultured Sulfurovum sp. TaxID=269237 RepID=A0A6S6SEV6_9BACT|nr:MAG: Unknown protein [uncultured Sulfurovum sp.]
MKIELLDLEFNSDFFYVQEKSIVEKITFNNRTFYSKFKKYTMPISPSFYQKYKKNELILAVPLIEKIFVNYIVIEYQQDDWNLFYSLLKHLLKSLEIIHFQAYINVNKELFQLFIPRNKVTLDIIYKEVETIKHLLEVKSKKSYKIYPNKNLPENLNIITLPIKKV